MTLAFIALFYWSYTSTITVKAPNFEAKVEAAKIMATALKTLQDYRLPGLLSGSGNGFKEPLTYTMLGEKDSPITTDEGRIEDKVTVLNPNFAAAMVQMMKEAKLNKGDTIAVMVTGSMPGANIAAYSAVKALGLCPVIITSVGSSWWGANSPDFTWLDMERVLYDTGLFDFRSVAASAGGSDDEGGLRLSDLGRQLITEAIQRNEVTFIREGSLTANMNGRKQIFQRYLPLERYKAVVNIGGGLAAMGDRANADLIPNGLSMHLPALNYPNLGLMHAFSDANVPVIQIYDVGVVARLYRLPEGQLPLPKIGEGHVFTEQRYNLATAWIALLLMFVVLAVVKFFDRKTFQWREEKDNPDTIV